MKDENQFDELIKKYAEKYGFDWMLIKAQVWAESNFNHDAVSPCGARGLLQIMPGTAEGYHVGYLSLSDPDINLDTGIRYLKEQYDHFPEIPDYEERLKFSLASYNCGRGYVNVALRLAFGDEFGAAQTIPGWERISGKWQTWDFTSPKLASPACRVKGKKPDHKQTTEYVRKIWEKFAATKAQRHEEI